MVAFSLLAALAASISGEPDGKAELYASAHYRLHTDIPAREAKDLLKDLETIYGQMAAYFGRGVIKPIPGFVVADVRNFPDLPDDARERVANNEGLTKGKFVGLRSRSRFIPKDGNAAFYACADKQIALHESVHAFCYLAFGTGGPIWYAEGMAELGHYWRGASDVVNADPRVIAYLQAQRPRSLMAITDEADDDPGTWRDYAWRWSVCHFMAHHPTYTKRFHRLGMEYLNVRSDTFASAFGPHAKEIVFEWLFFLEHMEPGYRVDLCAWEWKKATPRGTKKARILANRGWQASQLLAEEGVRYALRSSGKWSLEKRGKKIGPAGANGKGALLGILMTEDRKLSEPFTLGADKEWTAAGAGHLYLRCDDAWGSLADNAGMVKVTIRKAK